MGLFKRRLKDPVDGTVQIVSTTGRPYRAVYGICNMQVVVQAPGIEAFATEHSAGLVRASKWPVPGTILKAKVDREDPERFEILWDEVPTREEMAQDQAQAIAAAMRGEAPSGATAVPPGVPPAAAGVIAQLQKQFPGAQIHVQSMGGSPYMATSAAAPSAPPSGADPSGDDDRIAKLERLAELKADGVLTEAEFAAEKKRVLEGN